MSQAPLQSIDTAIAEQGYRSPSLRLDFTFPKDKDAAPRSGSCTPNASVTAQQGSVRNFSMRGEIGESSNAPLTVEDMRRLSQELSAFDMTNLLRTFADDGNDADQESEGGGELRRCPQRASGAQKRRQEARVWKRISGASNESSSPADAEPLLATEQTFEKVHGSRLRKVDAQKNLRESSARGDPTRSRENKPRAAWKPVRASSPAPVQIPTSTQREKNKENNDKSPEAAAGRKDSAMSSFISWVRRKSSSHKTRHPSLVDDREEPYPNAPQPPRPDIFPDVDELAFGEGNREQRKSPIPETKQRKPSAKAKDKQNLLTGNRAMREDGQDAAVLKSKLEALQSQRVEREAGSVMHSIFRSVTAPARVPVEGHAKAPQVSTGDQDKRTLDVKLPDSKNSLQDYFGLGSSSGFNAGLDSYCKQVDTLDKHDQTQVQGPGRTIEPLPKKSRTLSDPVKVPDSNGPENDDENPVIDLSELTDVSLMGDMARLFPELNRGPSVNHTSSPLVQQKDSERALTPSLVNDPFADRWVAELAMRSQSELSIVSSAPSDPLAHFHFTDGTFQTEFDDEVEDAAGDQTHSSLGVDFDALDAIGSEFTGAQLDGSSTPLSPNESDGDAISDLDATPSARGRSRRRMASLFAGSIPKARSSTPRTAPHTVPDFENLALDWTDLDPFLDYEDWEDRPSFAVRKASTRAEDLTTEKENTLEKIRHKNGSFSTMRQAFGFGSSSRDAAPGSSIRDIPGSVVSLPPVTSTEMENTSPISPMTTRPWMNEQAATEPTVPRIPAQPASLPVTVPATYRQSDGIQVMITSREIASSSCSTNGSIRGFFNNPPSKKTPRRTTSFFRLDLGRGRILGRRSRDQVKSKEPFDVVTGPVRRESGSTSSSHRHNTERIGPVEREMRDTPRLRIRRGSWIPEDWVPLPSSRAARSRSRSRRSSSPASRGAPTPVHPSILRIQGDEDFTQAFTAFPSAHAFRPQLSTIPSSDAATLRTCDDTGRATRASSDSSELPRLSSPEEISDLHLNDNGESLLNDAAAGDGFEPDSTWVTATSEVFEGDSTWVTARSEGVVEPDSAWTDTPAPGGIGVALSTDSECSIDSPADAGDENEQWMMAGQSDAIQGMTAAARSTLDSIPEQYWSADEEDEEEDEDYDEEIEEQQVTSEVPRQEEATDTRQHVSFPGWNGRRRAESHQTGEEAGRSDVEEEEVYVPGTFGSD